MSEKYFNYERLYRLLNKIVEFLYGLIYRKQIIKPHYEIVSKYTVGALKVCNESNFVDSSTCILKSNLPTEFQDVLDDGSVYIKLIEEKEVLYEKFIRKPYTESVRKTQFNQTTLDGNDIYVYTLNHNLGTKFVVSSIIEKDTGFQLSNNVQVVDNDNINIYLFELKDIEVSVIGWKGDVY